MRSYPSHKFELSEISNDLTLLFPLDIPKRNNRKGVYFIIGLKGNATIVIDGKDYQFNQSTVVSLTPCHLLSMKYQSHDFQFQYLFFEYDFLSDFPLLLKADISDKMGNNPILTLDLPTFRLIRHYYDFIFNRYQDDTCQVEIVKGLLFSFILELSRNYSVSPINVAVSRPNELTDQFFKLLHQYYKYHRTAQFYARELCISDKYLLRVIKSTTGSTFGFWVSDFIIKEAKLLLKSTQKSVTEISEELQFPNSSFFARYFKNHTGVSPMQFKRH